MPMRRAALLVAFATLAAPVAPARATQTDPVLVVVRALRADAAGGALVQIDAEFPSPDLVQRPIGLEVLVRDLAGDGTSHARFPLGGTPVSGVSAALADGLDPEDVAVLQASGTPLAGARVLHLGERRIDLWLPASFAPAAAEVQLFIVYEGDPLLSNPLPLEESAP